MSLRPSEPSRGASPWFPARPDWMAGVIPQLGTDPAMCCFEADPMPPASPGSRHRFTPSPCRTAVTNILTFNQKTKKYECNR